MPTLKIDVDEGLQLWVDRSGSAPSPGAPQGFYIHIGALLIEFEDENHAADLARLIANRLGMTL